MGGLSARQAAERFDVGTATAIVWVRRFREGGELVARRQGKPRGLRLDPHADYLLGLLEQPPDLTLAELAATLERERGIRVSLAMVWTFLDRHDMTFKKRPRRRPSSSGRTFRQPDRSGSNPVLTGAS
ncbi:transposase of insertion sequence ISRm10-1, orfA protein [Azotobacter vinelandii CA]|uniref:Transposase of insertion sequence ISRm10-1, orfA protein n=4 Tax=Azotobacter TaxID=352 RepID=C1DP65_AZOVD|nr:transposase of insertion sequence ISRm10-1, orfA protein [Azotobacter vinelandii DJ]AGK14689.1 transposase of insertion sequence ISRm10-1, orfA protein [Azotobacter vinelandii CA]AGK21211.1 transposase of insertion sequence ISRm10-1, orfA protein [Azotobacter vinelandii CA6]